MAEQGTGRPVRIVLFTVLSVLMPAALLVGCTSSSPGTHPSGRPPATTSVATSPSPATQSSASPSAREASSRSQAPSPTARTAAPSSPGASPSHHWVTSAPGSLHALLTQLSAAIRHGRRADFRALISHQDPGFTGTAEMIFDNLQGIGPSSFSLEASGDRRRLSKARRAVLGPNAYAAQVRVTWSVPGDRAPSDQRVWMTVDKTGNGLGWAGISDGPPGPRPTPLWWLEPVHYIHTGAVTVIAGDGIDPQGWAAAANTAVAKDVPRLRGADWNRRLVIIVPSNERLLEQSIGAARGTDSALAGITWPDGTRPAAAPIRIMINATGQPDSLATAIVLAHEAVHVATRSPISPAPTWLVEGYADYIAYLSYPQGAQVAADDLLNGVKRDGPPDSLPGESDFGSQHPDLNRTYAEAWSVCRYLAEHYGSQKLWKFYQAVDQSPDGSIDGPARSAFGISQRQLVTGWQQHLRTAVHRGRI